MVATRVDEAAVDSFAQGLRGDLILPSHTAYEDARKVQNGMIDKRPALIARCLGSSDIVDAVNFARSHGLDISVRGGGHNVAGIAVCDGGLMIDLSTMQSVHVDPNARVARADGGVTWGGFNHETQVHGLATTGGVVSTTGIAGLTLGGGIGWLMGKYGLASDNLVGAELVTAGGDVLQASADEHPDLFWALRGGGGNFGVVSSFEYRLHPVGPQIVGGLAAHPLEAARDVLRFYREFTASLPDELIAFAALTHAPDGSGLPIAGIAVCHCGPLDEAQAAVRPIKEFGSPVVDVVGPMPYEAINQMLDAAYPKGALNYWKSNFLTGLTDEAIDTMVEHFSNCTSPMSSMLVEHLHGAATRADESETAFPHRRDGYNLLVAAEWLDPGETDQQVAWARAAYAAMEPHMRSGRYVNYMGEDEEGDPARAAYGANYARLQAIKKEYDPDNVFHANQNIKPN